MVSSGRDCKPVSEAKTSWRSVMKKSLLTVLFLIILVLGGCRPKTDISSQFSDKMAIQVVNPTDLIRRDEVVELPVHRLVSRLPGFNSRAFLVLDNDRELASQAIDRDNDGQAEQILAVLDLLPQQSRTLQILTAPGDQAIPRSYPKRTQATLAIKTGGQFSGEVYQGGTFSDIRFLRVPDHVTDHSEYIRFEGPGWESDRVGYRFYLDWRNAIDVFGKKKPELVLHKVGLDGYESYHHLSDWGMDVLKVGESLGLGSIAMWHDGRAERVADTDSVTCEIVYSGDVESLIRTTYFGWKVGDGSYRLTSELSIRAGSRLTRHDLQVQGDPPNLCTGIVKLADGEWMADDVQEVWSTIATYGKQSLAEDDLGLAVIFRRSDLIRLEADVHSHVAILQPQQGALTTYFLAAWTQEADGITNKDAFLANLHETTERLSKPVRVDY